MEEALKEARKALEYDEVPIGAIIVKDGQIIGRGHNMRESNKSPLAHAELMAIEEAAKTLDSWRLLGTTIYVTLEPCPMCAGAIVNSRIDRLVIGADDPKSGACGSVVNILEEGLFNHNVEITRNILGEDCSHIIRSFFKKLRGR